MYNPYNPYEHLFPNQQMIQPGQFMPNAMPPTAQSQPAVPSVVQVSTLKQVEQAPVTPGGRVLVLVSSEPIIAMRTADSMGIASTDYYKIEPFDPSASMPRETDFVTREEFQKFVDSLTAKNEPTAEKEAKAK